MRILQKRNNIFQRHIIDEWFSYKFKENKSHCQLNTFYKFEENANSRKFRQFLQTIHSWFLEKIQNSHSNDQKAREFRMNYKNRRSFQSSQKNDDENSHIATLRSNQTNHFENRLFKLRQRESTISIRRRRSFASRCFLQSKHDFSRMQLWNLRQKVVNHYSLFKALTLKIWKHWKIDQNFHWSQETRNLYDFEKTYFSSNSLSKNLLEIQHCHSILIRNSKR